MLSRSVADAASALRRLGGVIRQAAEQSSAALRRVDDELASLDASWGGPTPAALASQSAGATARLAPWPYALDGAAKTLERWSQVADALAADARRAERRLADAHRAVPVDRDVQLRTARSAIDTVADHWATTSHHHRLALDGPMNALARIGSGVSLDLQARERAVTIALGLDALDMDIEVVDRTDTIQRELTAVLDEVVNSPLAPLIFSVLETARDRDLFRADDDLSRDDLDAVDEQWAAEAISVWQEATGGHIADDVAAAVAAMIPTVAGLMRADGARDWTSERDSFTGEPALRDLLTDAAVGAFVRGPRFVSERPDTADAVEAFMRYGAGDIDNLPDLPTSSELGYHYHGPPSIESSFQTTDVFRHLVFDWQQVWGEERSIFGGGIEVVGLLPTTKALKFARGTKLLRNVRILDKLDLIENAADARRLTHGGLIAHEGPVAHTIRRHVEKSGDDLTTRMANDPTIDIASSFFDLETADRAVAAAVDSTAEEIADWISKAPRRATLEIDASFTEPIGIVVYRSSLRKIASAHNLRVVLLREPTMPGGYLVLTTKLD